ncbi:unnamed protein product [Tuber aestivum]|uniref:Protein kinase domain-containing protein n=1 Tax=Tuber aestivum TaxID=59557 RepID=A0A292PZW5_9PEZI|nr:unnamed protein product [Tuber aestivum]
MEVQTEQPDGNALTTTRAIRDALAGESTEQLVPIWLDPMVVNSSNAIGYSGAQVVTDSTGTKYVTETIAVDPRPRNHSQLSKDVEKLARVLRESKDVPGVLTCKGVIRGQETDGAPEKFEFIYEMPPALDNAPKCLRTVLLKSPQEPHPLEERVLLAKQVAKAVMFVHNLNFVHKNMRPETILVFPNPGKTLGIPFIVGFQMFRAADGSSYMAGDESWSKNLYRHPSRQGNYPDNKYKMQHDIYSLGVILLEIGLWTPLVGQMGEPGVEFSQIVPLLQDRDQRRKAARIKKELVTMAYNHLPPRMGTKYSEVVVSCLMCLERDPESGSESEYPDDDGTLILNMLEEIDV